MRRAIVTLSVLLSVACASAPNKIRGSTSDMRKFKSGLCTEANMPGTGAFPHPNTSVFNCIQVGAPGTLGDDGQTPIIISKFVGWDFQTTNPGNFQLEVWRNNELVLKQMLPESVPDIGTCTSSSCIKIGISVIAFPPGWQPGDYTFKYTCSFNTSYVGVTYATVTAAGGMSSTAAASATPPAARAVVAPVPATATPTAATPTPATATAASAPMAGFSSTRPAKNTWPDNFRQSYVSGCTKGLAARYGAKRTQQQIQYACDCIAWGLEDRWAYLALTDALKKDPTVVQDATAEISIECKRNRPVELGPDPG